MNTANVIDLHAYRERRTAKTPGRQSSAHHGVENSFGFLAVPFPVPVLVGCFPFWIVMGIPVMHGVPDA